jgi:pimeloyl-ACP methyl ester carboxylesterase
LTAARVRGQAAIVEPATRYAKSGDVHIVYQVLGEGPRDLVFVPGVVSHVEFFHELPRYTDFLRGLARFARVIVFDKRGNGLSDSIVGAPSLEERMDDISAVMEAVGSKRVPAP